MLWAFSDSSSFSFLTYFFFHHIRFFLVFLYTSELTLLRTFFSGVPLHTADGKLLTKWKGLLSWLYSIDTFQYFLHFSYISRLRIQVPWMVCHVYKQARPAFSMKFVESIFRVFFSGFKGKCRHIAFYKFLMAYPETVLMQHLIFNPSFRKPTRQI